MGKILALDARKNKKLKSLILEQSDLELCYVAEDGELIKVFILGTIKTDAINGLIYTLPDREGKDYGVFRLSSDHNFDDDHLESIKTKNWKLMDLEGEEVGTNYVEIGLTSIMDFTGGKIEIYTDSEANIYSNHKVSPSGTVSGPETVTKFGKSMYKYTYTLNE